MFKLIFIIFSIAAAVLIAKKTENYGEREFVRMITGRWTGVAESKFVLWQAAFLTCAFGVAIPLTLTASALIMRVCTALEE